MRFGLVMAASVAGAFLALWPTLERLSGGKSPVPAYIQERVAFRLVAGSISGGLRLVYTVDVDEAIKDKRDRYYEEMRVELSKLFGLHTGDDRPTEEITRSCASKVEPRSRRASRPT